MHRSNLSHVLIDIIFHAVIPGCDIGVFLQILESLAPFDAAKNAVDRDVSEVRLVSTKEGTFSFDGGRPLSRGVVEGFTCIFFDVMPGIKTVFSLSHD